MKDETAQRRRGAEAQRHRGTKTYRNGYGFFIIIGLIITCFALSINAASVSSLDEIVQSLQKQLA